MDNKKAKGFYATLEPFKKKKVVYLQPYYYQGGKWYRLGGKKNVGENANTAISKKATT